jgi:hypothetical protein
MMPGQEVLDAVQEKPKPLIPQVWTDPKALQRAYDFVKEKIDENFEDHRARSQKWLEFDQVYRLIDKNKPSDGCQVVDPEPQVEVDTLKANVVEGFFAQDPPFKYTGQEESDDEQAEIMTAYRADHLRRIQLREKFERTIHQCLINGTALIKTPYKREIEKKRVKVMDPLIGIPVEKEISIPKMDDTDWEYVSIFDFIPVGSGSSIQDLEGCIHLTSNSFDDLKKNERKTESIDGMEITKGIYYNLESIHTPSTKFKTVEYWGRIPKFITTGIEGDRYLTFEGVITCVMEFDDQEKQSMKRQHSEKTGESSYKKEDYGKAESCIRLQENPFWDMERPFLSSPWTPIDDEFYGIGMIEPIVDKWHELNTTIRQLVDCKTIQLNMPMIEDTNANVQRDIRLVKNPRIKSDDINGIRPLPLTDFSANGWNIIAAIKDDMRRASGALDALQGTAMSKDTSATEFQGVFQQAGIRLKDRIKIIDEKLFKPFLNRCYKYDQQFAEFERIVRVVGKKGAAFKRVSPEQIWGNFDIVSKGPGQIENNVIMTNKLVNFLSIVSRLPNIANLPELIKKIWVYMGFPESEADTIVLAPEMDSLEKIKEENMAMAMGQPVSAKPGDNHLLHLQLHAQAYQILKQVGKISVQSEQAFQQNLAEHQTYLSQTSGGMNPMVGSPMQLPSVGAPPTVNPQGEVPQNTPGGLVG